MRRGVFLDRDGVLNEPVVRNGLPFPPASPDEVLICDGARFALESLRRAGFVLICVTNQPDVARGSVSIATVNAINSRLCGELHLDDIVVCPHDDADCCDCRKPKPGMMQRSALRHGIDLVNSYLVGDRWRDIEAGAAAQCRTVLVDRGYLEQQSSIEPNARVASIGEAAMWILADAASRFGLGRG